MFKILFLFLIIGPSLIFAQTSDTLKTADSVNISQMVQQQIYKAHQKEDNEISVQKKEVQLMPEKHEADFNFNGIQTKLALLFVMIITAAYMLVKKRKKQEEIPSKNKAKVVQVPEIKTYEKELRLIRTGLKDNAPFFMLSEKELSNAARDLKISKGELYLAAVLKSQELAKIKNNMFGVYND